MGERTELIKVRVTPDQYDDITEYLDETEEFGSLSTFGQHVLMQYVREDDEESSVSVDIDQEDIIDAVDMGISPVTEYLERLETEVLELQNLVQTDTEVRELADQVYDRLVEVPDGQTIEDMTPLQPEEAFLVGTPEAIADEFGEETGAIRRALDMADRLYPDVEYIKDEIGERRYYREE